LAHPVGSESRFLPTPPAFDALLLEFLSEYGHAVWYTEKLEWLGYPMVNKILKVCLFVLTQSTNVTDGQTQTPHDG